MILQKMSVSLDFSKLKDRRKEKKKKREERIGMYYVSYEFNATDRKIKCELG